MASYSVPDDLPVAQLLTIDAKGLIDGASYEGSKLLEACKRDGFFYFDIRGMGPEISLCIERIYELEKKLYDLPLDEKMQYDIDKLCKMKLNGYKPVGRNFGGIDGKRDGFETYAIPNDGVMALQDRNFKRLPIVDEYMMTLKFFSTGIATAAHSILTSLSNALQIPAGQRFEDYHRPHVPSPDVIRLLKYHAQAVEERGASHTPHTDLGSLTFLFTQQPGLQVISGDENDWAWVQPKAGHAIVNLGDGMKTLSNGYLRSCLHRVGPLPGSAMQERYSFAYLMRAEDKTLMTGLESPFFGPALSQETPFTSGEWIQRKFGMLRGNTEKPDQEKILTGGHVVGNLIT